MPLHAEHEPAVRRLDRLREVVDRREAGDLEAARRRRPRPDDGGTWSLWSSSPAASAASEPGGQPDVVVGVVEASRIAAVVARGRPRRAGAGSASRRSATLISCMPRQMPSTGMSRSIARRASASSARSRSGTVCLVIGMTARRRRATGRCRRRRRGSGRRSRRAPGPGCSSRAGSGGIISAMPPARWIAVDVADGQQRRPLVPHAPAGRRASAAQMPISWAHRLQPQPITRASGRSGTLHLPAGRLRAARRRTRRSGGTCRARSRA